MDKPKFKKGDILFVHTLHNNFCNSHLHKLQLIDKITKDHYFYYYLNELKTTSNPCQYSQKFETLEACCSKAELATILFT